MKDYAFDLTDALQSPVIVHAPAWKDCVPKRMYDIVSQSRLVSLMKGEEMGTLAECSIYLMTRSFEAPMSSEWTDIFTYVSCTTLKDFFQEDHFEDVRAPRQLSEWLDSQLRGLRRHIYEKRRKALKERMKVKKQQHV